MAAPQPDGMRFSVAHMRLFGETLGVRELQEEAAAALAADTEFRVRQVIQVSASSRLALQSVACS